jgi:hypothetical protein
MLQRLWRPSEKDIGSGTANIRRWLYVINAPGGFATGFTYQDPNGPFPADQVYVIQSLSFSWNPGAAQQGLRGSIQIIDPTSFNILTVIERSPDQLYQGQQCATVGGLELPIMQGELLQLVMSFNGGVNSNSGSIYLHGFQFPRGQMQR